MQYGLVDSESGTLISDLVPVKGDTSYRQARVITAFIKREVSRGKKLYFGTLGTSSTDYKRVSGFAQRYFRGFSGGNQYCYVIEKGSRGGRVHIHYIVNCWEEWEDVLRRWSEITGERHPHVLIKEVYGEAHSAGRYLAKYLRKKDGDSSMRCFRTGKGLVAELTSEGWIEKMSAKRLFMEVEK